MRSLIIIGAFIIVIACTNPNRKDRPAHHTDTGFQNSDPTKKSQGFGKVIQWKFGNLFKKLPSVEPEDYKFETFENEGTELRSNDKNFTITWVGHASILIQMDEKNILTDPIWSERCSPVSFAGPKRYAKPGIPFDKLPRIDLVIISHNHYDHMDIPTLKKLSDKFQPLILAGLKNKKHLESEGIQNVKELDWWQNIEFKDLKITFTPTQHFSGRGLFDRDETLWGSYVVQGKEKSFYFAGDTGYFSGFAEIGKKFPALDIAILPIGAYEPIWFMSQIHVSPEEAVKAFLDLGAKEMLPMHYQTFVLTDEALDEPLKLTKENFIKRGIEINRLIDLKIGETR